jgi:hypothetical protein
MTISDAQSTLFSFFLKNDTFSLKDDFSRTFLPIGDENVLKKITEKALDEYEKNGLVARLSDTHWVLAKPLDQFNQAIQIDGNTANAISELLNKYCEKYNDTYNLCNPLNIIERDLVNLLKIIDQFEQDPNMDDVLDDDDGDDDGDDDEDEDDE